MDTGTVKIFDTTLRDGEQSPGATLTRPEKVEIARHLEQMGVDIIEAGFPIASDGDFESVRAIAGEIGKSVVCGLSRTTPKIHREHKLKKGRDEIIRTTRECVQQALQYTKDVAFSPEDASRTELDF